MASTNYIPWEQALAAEKAAFDQNRQLRLMGVAPEGGFRDDFAYMGDTFDPEKWLQQKGFWQQGFRPGMALPQMNASNFEDFVEMATPLAVMAGTALGGNALFGPGGMFAGSGAAAGGLAEEMAALGIADGGAAGLAGGAAGGAGAAGSEYLASLDAADAVLGQDMLNLASTQGVDLSPLWNSNVFGAAGGAAAASGLGGLIKGIGSGFKDLLGGVKGLMPSGGAFDTALATAPVLAAINYAKNQSPFDVSRLEDTYNQFSPDALAYEFDQNTARGRDALTSSLTNRGVMGSSFGNMDLTNFQTSRDLGRRSLVNQGLAQRGNIAATMLDAKVKERGLKNDLYGRSLLALGNIFGGRNQVPVNA
jgi:hypothetical protein